MAPRIRNLDTRWTWVVNSTIRSLYAQKVTSVPTEMETRWAPEPIWVFRSKEKSLSAAGIRTPVRPARSLVTTTTTLSQLGPHSYNIHFNKFPAMPNLQIVPSLQISGPDYAHNVRSSIRASYPAHLILSS